MTEPIAGPSGAGTVVLDLGAGIGVLVLYTPASMDGHEIEISPSGQAGSGQVRRTHARVRRRDTMTGTVYAAVYPCLPAGEYVIWRDDQRWAGRATITGGQVTTCEWPG
ncbi:MAG: hypothetical protein JO345_23210 [Streptosporangiaceae bacterium]|nr:hypothetical protein [Streptosporangiaceae bacterium]